MPVSTVFFLGAYYVACVGGIRLLQNILGGGDIALAFLSAAMSIVLLRGMQAAKTGKPLALSGQFSLAVLLSIFCLFTSFVAQILWQVFVYPQIEVPILLLGHFVVPFLCSPIFYSALRRAEEKRNARAKK